jgi:regulator of sigma E protease
MGQLGLELARPSAVLGRVSPGGAADRAGLKEGDRILEIDDVPVTDALALVTTVRASPGRLLSLHGLRDGEEFDAAVTPEADTASGNAVGRIQVGLLLTPAMTITTDGPVTALHKGALRTWDTSLLTIKMIGKMIAGDVSIKNLTGPITIADYAGQTARAGLISFMSFMALISISLGVMNLLPIPVLDGGLLLYYSLEVLTGRPISERFGDIAQRAGAGILMTLMCVAVFNDLTRLFS